MWPKNSITKKPNWRSQFHIRIIKDRADEIEWGLPYPVFTEAETLAFLVRKGVLPADWKHCYQTTMQIELSEKARGRG